MATSLQDLQTRLDELNEAIADPARQVTLGSQNITLRSIDDLIKARNDLVDQIAAATPVTESAPRRNRRFYAVYTGRGFD